MIQNNFNLFINTYNDENYIHDFIRLALFQTIKFKKKFFIIILSLATHFKYLKNFYFRENYNFNSRRASFI